MNWLHRTLIASLGAVLVSGCAITPKTAIVGPKMCDLPRHHLKVELPGGFAPQSTGDGSDFEAALRETYANRFELQSLPPPGEQPISDSMLFLSGGSQNGAFGAGFLDGWAANRTNPKWKGKLPRFRVVTGISTGAILSTFAFLGEPQVAAGYYQIARETDVLHPYVKSGEIGIGSLPTILRKGAVGELAPLRRKLRVEINDARLRAIADEQRKGRRLYVGAVDVDMGQAVAFDLTATALRYTQLGEGDDAGRELLRDCYVETILASSAVPLAAPPVFIDNRMYIDGGARYGVFTEAIGAAIGPSAAATVPATAPGSVAPTAPAAQPSIYVLINGSLTTEAQCGKVWGCASGMWAIEGAHAKWKLHKLAQRSVSVLINQVYRFSTARALHGPVPARPELIKIETDMEAHPFKIGGTTKRCAEWKTEDALVDKPLEFHWRYMRCLVDYGRTRAASSGWINVE